MIKTRQQAMKEAKRRWGKNAAISDNGWRCASSNQEREAARAKLRELNANKPTDKEQLRAWRKSRDEHLSASHRYQYTVGEIHEVIPGFPVFAVAGQGDTWDDAFADVDRRAEADRQRYSKSA